MKAERRDKKARKGTGQAKSGADPPTGAPVPHMFRVFLSSRERLAAMAGFYGLLAGVQYAEPFVQKEVGLVEDLLHLPVQSL